jgi:hypothetical protein
MTPIRLLLILAVVVAVLFGISLALMQRNAGDQPSPTGGWVNDLKEKLWGSRRFDVEKDFASSCRQGRQWQIPQTSVTCSAILTNSSDRQVKELKLTLAASSVVQLSYEPFQWDGEVVDRGAVTLTINRFEPGKSLKLVLLPHGGTLTLRRLGGVGPAIVKLE